ncbi:MAG: TIGR00269 family protein [Candidatus Aenigmatarchaeota archaeon]|nr:MAG: TIGR00269 family protein [Candidatus Aenigmarchaeota archaeon]
MKCSCGREAIYYRRYEGRFYCENCLSKQIEKTFKQTIGKYHLLDKKDHVIVAVSGGKDSGSLLYLMSKVFGEVRTIKISALIIDEGIKNYRTVGIKKAKELCTDLNIPLHIASFKEEFGKTMDKITKKTDNPCTFCGVFKRYLLNKKTRELGGTKLAVGHNLNDEAESIMMNLIRGDLTRFERLGPKPGLIRNEKFIPRIKPLIKVPEKELMLFAMVNKIPFFKSRCPYSYNNVRRDVMNIINELEEKYPSTKKQIVGFYNSIMKKMKIEAGGKLKFCKLCGEPTTQEICKACEFKNLISKF